MGSNIHEGSCDDHNDTLANPQATSLCTPQKRRYPGSLNKASLSSCPRKRNSHATYERLEDLLREAGYKETRVFTPISERRKTQYSERGRQALHEESAQELEGGVTSFLTGLMSIRGRSLGDLWNVNGALSTPTIGGSRGRNSEIRSAQLKKQASNVSSSHGWLRYSRSTSTLPASHSPRKRTSKARGSATPPARSQRIAPFLRRDSHGSTASIMVTRTSVVCRATPSRASSRTRGERKVDLPPSLAQTESMNDPWTQTLERAALRCEGSSDIFRQPIGAGTSEQSDEEDEEIGLEAILMPPKRQQSIRSLRRHLSRSRKSGSNTDEEGRRQWEELGLDWTKKTTSTKKRQELPVWD